MVHIKGTKGKRLIIENEVFEDMLRQLAILTMVFGMNIERRSHGH